MTSTPMTRRPLGNSGLWVTPMGLGMAALGRPGYMTLGHGDDLPHETSVEAMEEHAHAVLDAAWAQGLRYFDAARSYGRAEQFLASWLALRGLATADDAPIVGSKWGYIYTADWQVHAETHEVKQLTVENLRRQWQETQALLPGRVNLYQVHSVTLESGVLEDATVLGELARLKQSGVHVGLTLSGPRQAETLRHALTVRVDGVALFETVQATWNLLERSAGSALAEAHAQDVGVIVKEAVANGRLTTRNQEAAFAPAMNVLEQQAARLACTIDALALAAVLAQPWAGVVLSGAASVEQVQANARALDVAWDDEAEAALAPIAEQAEAYWNTRAELPWN